MRSNRHILDGLAWLDIMTLRHILSILEVLNRQFFFYESGINVSYAKVPASMLNSCCKAQFAQAFRWATKLAICSRLVHFKNGKIIFVECEQNSLEQYCQQHCHICKPALNVCG
jgi:hypothetical protein